MKHLPIVLLLAVISFNLFSQEEYSKNKIRNQIGLSYTTLGFQHSLGRSYTSEYVRKLTPSFSIAPSFSLGYFQNGDQRINYFGTEFTVYQMTNTMTLCLNGYYEFFRDKIIGLELGLGVLGMNWNNLEVIDLRGDFNHPLYKPSTFDQVAGHRMFGMQASAAALFHVSKAIDINLKALAQNNTFYELNTWQTDYTCGANLGLDIKF